MTFASDYNPTNSFADDETNEAAGRSTVRTVELDNQFADIAAAHNELNANVKKIQRDDDKLRDFIVEPYALSEKTRAIFAAGGRNVRGEWAVFTTYAVGDLIQRNAVAYICQTAHNSGPTFNLGFWIALTGDGSAEAWAEQAQESKNGADAAAVAAIAAASTAGAAAVEAGASADSAAANAIAAQNSADSIAGLSPVNLSAFMLDVLSNTTAAATRSDLGAVGLPELATASGASMVGFQAFGAGAIYRTVQSKLRDSVSVKDFGAVGDGATDDTAAIQAALDSIHTTSAGSASGGVVFLPRGRYKITAPIQLRYGISLKGAGAQASILECYDCDGIVRQMGFEDHNMNYVEDVGFIGMSGTNRTAILDPELPYPDNQNDGFFVNRCSIRNFNVGVQFLCSWQTAITNCDFSKVNCAVVLDKHCVLVNVRDNTMVHEGGGPGAYNNIGVYVGGPDVEALEIASNFIYGFATAVRSSEGWSLVIKSNTILTVGANQIGIDFTTVKEHLNIFDNVIESMAAAGQTVRGIWGRSALTWGGGSTVIRDNRIFDDYALGDITGIQINDPTDSEQNNVSIYDNNFLRCTSADIRIYNPKRITVKNNRCESTQPTNSIEVLAPVAFAGPVYVEENWCTNALSLPAAHTATGQIVVRDNAVSGVFTPYEVNKVSWTPDNASTDPVTLTVAYAFYSRRGKQYTVTLDVTWPVTAGTEVARVTLPSLPNAAYTGGIGYSTFGTFLGFNTSAAGNNFILYGADGVFKTNANMSGKRIVATIVYEAA